MRIESFGRRIGGVLAAAAALLVLLLVLSAAIPTHATAAQAQPALLVGAPPAAVDGVHVDLPRIDSRARVDVLTRAGVVPELRPAEISTSRESPSGRDPLPWGMGLIAVGGMVALARDRDTPRRGKSVEVHPVAAGAKIYAGALLVLDAGYAAPGRVALNLIAVGRANAQVDNTGGAAGDLSVEVERGVFLFAQDGTITQADVGKDAYIVDDQTVADNNGAGTRSKAGTIRGVESGGVWVEI